MTDYEAATSFLGEWGPFQQRIFYLLSLSLLPVGFHGMIIVFLADTPAHRCVIPAHVNLSDAWRNSSIPLEVHSHSGALVHSRCSRYKLNVMQDFSQRGLMPGVDVNLSNVEQERCLDGWEYDQSVYTSTIVSEWDLVCDNSWKTPLTSSINFCGVFAGSLVSGQLSDRYGRKVVLFVALATQTLFSSIQAFAPSWPVFCAIFFVVGMTRVSIYMCAFVLGTEILNPRVRTAFATLGSCLFFSLGYLLLPLGAFFIRDWRMLALGLSLPCCLLAPLWWFIPESPRWLLSQGRVEDAEVIIKDAAKTNKIEPPPIIFTPLQPRIQSDKKKSRNIWDLLRFSNIRWISLTLWLVWIVVNIGYFGLSLNTSNLHGNPHFNCFLSAVVEVPAYISSWFLFRWCSRRLSTSSTLLIGGVFLLLIQLIPTDMTVVAISLEMMGKFAVTTGYTIVYAYTAEVYPTVLRNTALGVCSMAARIGGIIAPYFVYLRTYSVSLPYILMGSLTALSGLLSLLLPESFGMPLPETLSQMQPFPGCCRKKLYSPAQTTEEENATELKPPVMS
ncbi:solute carrier family 22 member 5-like isoform X2 [Sphaeramia orbicularis]|uniref:solute carrier family 22 member 5-like isoform X2 n=1 Tax=Sphaeramia orbicularis TaxID=375764 RepID=UPI00117E4BE5|nr:solute carrier family 22 member 5-like isoform X2 [Sphaeramia orbicularis]